MEETTGPIVHASPGSPESTPILVKAISAAARQDDFAFHEDFPKSQARYA
jgi:hypothetical protein